MKSDLIPKDLLEIVDRKVSELSEHFDSVRIFVTRSNGETGNTESCTVGAGNIYAQIGHIQEFMNVFEQYDRNAAIREETEGPQ